MISRIPKLRGKSLLVTELDDEDGRYVSDIGLVIGHVRRLGRAARRLRVYVDDNRTWQGARETRKEEPVQLISQSYQNRRYTPVFGLL